MPNMIPPPVLLPLAMKTMAATKHTEARNPAQPGLAGKRGLLSCPPIGLSWDRLGPPAPRRTQAQTNASAH